MSWPVSKLISKVLTSVITPKVGYRTLFAKADGWYDKDDAGVETKVSNEDSAPYLAYSALLTQSGTSAPTAVVLDNTLGGAVTYAYVSEGLYTIVSSALFTSGKTVVIFGGTDVSSTVVTSVYTNSSAIALGTEFANLLDQGFEVKNGKLNSRFIEIRVYS